MQHIPEITMDLHQQFGLRRVINACGKMTKLCGAIVLPEIIDVVDEAMRHFFVLDEVQRSAGRLISQVSGAESGCVTACTSAGITLSVAATLTGNDLARALQLPNTTGMANRVLIQKGHCVNYGAPITQSIRLAGAEPIEIGSVNACTSDELHFQLNQPGVASIVTVESHHTVRHGWVPLPEVVELAHAANVPRGGRRCRAGPEAQRIDRIRKRSGHYERAQVPVRNDRWDRRGASGSDRRGLSTESRNRSRDEGRKGIHFWCNGSVTVPSSGGCGGLDPGSRIARSSGSWNNWRTFPDSS